MSWPNITAPTWQGFAPPLTCRRAECVWPSCL
jgi:hypothetical protein